MYCPCVTCSLGILLCLPTPGPRRQAHHPGCNWKGVKVLLQWKVCMQGEHCSFWFSEGVSSAGIPSGTDKILSSLFGPHCSCWHSHFAFLSYRASHSLGWTLKFLGFFLHVIAREWAEVKELKTLMIPQHVKGPLHSNQPQIRQGEDLSWGGVTTPEWGAPKPFLWYITILSGCRASDDNTNW